MSEGEVEAKALDLISPILGAEKSNSLIEAFRTIEALDDVKKLRPLWTPEPGTPAQGI